MSKCKRNENQSELNKEDTEKVILEALMVTQVLEYYTWKFKREI